jgi:DNA-binding NtrC family response regulator
VRVIAATHRDLRGEVNAGRFRSDLYFRLAVAKIEIPPLRHRPEDIPAIVEQLLGAMHANEARRATILTPETMARLQRAAWPGNVRELRNYIERILVFDRIEALPEQANAVAEPVGGADASLPFAEARGRVLERFERAYLEALLALFDRDIAAAAEHSGVDRGYLYKLLRRHALKPGR